MSKRSGVGVTLLAVAALAIIAIFRKGLWYDEAWTLFLSRHPERWLFDAHPPLFFKLTSLFAPANEIVGRLLNILYLAVAGLLTLILAGRTERARGPLAIGAVVMLTNPLALYAIIDFRSYALLLAAWGSAVASFLVIHHLEDDFEAPQTSVAAISSGGIIAALNLHYLSSGLVGTMLGVFIAFEWIDGKRRWAVIHFTAGVVGSVLLLATIWIHWPHLQEIGELEWASSTLKAVTIIVSVFALLFGANIVAFGASLWRLADNEDLRFALACVTALIAASAVAVSLNAFHGVLLTRYLMSFVPVAAIAVGTLASRNLGPRLYAAFVANALVVALIYLVTDRRENWSALGREIAAIKRGCPKTQIVSVQSWRMAGFRSYPLKDDKAALQLGYDLVGKRYGFSPIMTSEAVRPGRCPVVVWAEHYRFPIPSPQDIAHRANVSGRFGEIRSSKTGFIAIFH